MEKQRVKTRDGRTIEVFTAGNSKSQAVVFHHGTPSSAITWEKWLPIVAERGIFAIAATRAGYGASDRRAGRSFGDNVSDTADILDHFGITEFVSIGLSGGGPHALSDSQDSRNKGVISMAGVAPFGDPAFDFLAGMGEENEIEFGATLAGEAALTKWMAENSPGMKSVTPELLIKEFGGLLSDADKAIFTPEVATSFVENLHDALSVSYYGWFDDDIACVKEWGFDLGAIKVPVELWQGDQDFMVPHSHGEYLHSKMPGSKLVFKPGEGHLSLGENSRSEIIAAALHYLK